MVITVLLDKIRSMYNVGSAFRTCDGAGVSKLILTGYTATPPRKEISKTALHADEVVAWEHFEDPLDAIAQLKADGFRIVAIEKNAHSIPLKSLEYTEESKVCFVFGNEVEGVSEGVLAEADMICHLPMLGIKESLNVAVCVGAVLYHFI